MRAPRFSKEAFLVGAAENARRILHVGCTNSPTTARRLELGTLLHPKLCTVAARRGSTVVGIDIDEEALVLLRRAMPGQALLHVDAHDLARAFEGQERFDLVIAGDVIEHLSNPGLFLESCARVLAPGTGRLAVTTANAFGVVRFLKATLGHEAVHAEHTAYYSRATLTRLLEMCGLRAIAHGYYAAEPLTSWLSVNQVVSHCVEGVVCALLPQFSEGVIAVACAR